ncbi:hypothetical protein BO71DRAFT_443236 [Aspergillus ellipticus CBS 707.79]|uniref:Uncharacterized protein n=1 Tax=Aspergillus ellipticus CBS 707.79 TaxID=1448320 RepID=A0A319DAI6_9EURO|nr:hypothetical protein BO71DRAFT_443236 [Aspergillus ellipticus CBS 707.79]
MGSRYRHTREASATPPLTNPTPFGPSACLSSNSKGRILLRQDDDGPVPGGYINRFVWARVPAESIQCEEFWAKSFEYREGVRCLFRIAFEIPYWGSIGQGIAMFLAGGFSHLVVNA